MRGAFAQASGHTRAGADSAADDPTPGAGDSRFNYQLLARLKQDCDYFLGAGGRAPKHLWAGSVSEQITKMRDLYEGFSMRPEWISIEDIDRYESAMLQETEHPRPRG